MSGSLDNRPTRLFDGRDLALWLVVDRDGVAQAGANIPKRTAAELLREIAHRWEQEAVAEDET